MLRTAAKTADQTAQGRRAYQTPSRGGKGKAPPAKTPQRRFKTAEPGTAPADKAPTGAGNLEAATSS